MAENDNVSDSPDRDVNPAETPGEAPAETPAEAPTSEQPAAAASPAVSSEPAAAAPVLKTRWRDRAWSFRAMIAVALASLVIGGVVGGVVGAVASGDDDDGHYRMGPWGPGMQVPPGWRDHGPRHFGGDGGPGWRWDDGQRQGPGAPSSTTPSTPTPSTPTPSTPGSTG